MDDLKYIVVIEEQMGLEVPIMFSSLLSHSEVAGNKTVISAGFCRLECSETQDDPVRVSFWGDSTSLKLKSREEDKALLEKEINRWRKY